jgi:hypothetical protein
MTFAEFAATIHTHIFPGTVRGIVSKPTVKPIDWRGFGSKRASEDTATVVISDEGVTGFAVEAHEIIETLGVAAALNHECKVNGETLKTNGGDHDGGGTARSLAEFCGEANGTFIDRTGHGQSREATRMAMQLRQTPEVEMAKTLVPEHRERRSAKTADEEVAGHGRELGVTIQGVKQRERGDRRGV